MDANKIIIQICIHNDNWLLYFINCVIVALQIQSNIIYVKNIYKKDNGLVNN